MRNPLSIMQAKPIFLNTVFERNSKMELTPKSSLYHDIIRYDLTEEKNGKGVGLTDLAKWLMKNNQEFRNYYSGSKSHVPMRARIANRRDIIEKCVDDLKRLNIIYQSGIIKARTTSDLVPIYRRTRFGDIMNLLLFERNKPNRREIANERILEILLSLFEKYDSVSTAFISRFYKNAKDKGIFDNMLDMCLRIMEDPNLQLINVVEALDRVYQIIITDKATRQGT